MSENARRKIILENDKQIKLFSRYMEMAAARAEDIKKTYYHGTSTVEAAKSILQTGIHTPDLKDRHGKLRPVEGRAYVTPFLEYAMVYALGGPVVGENADWLKKEFGQYGYLFVVPGSEIKDLEPDEDSVGEILHDIVSGYQTHKNYDESGDTDWLLELAEEELVNVFPEDLGYGDEVEYSEPTDDGDIMSSDPFEGMDMYDRVRRYSEYGDLAAAGKYLIPKMTDEQRLQLIDMGCHVAHKGSLKPSECWKIDRDKCQQLKKDGSNFFKIAKKVNVL